MKIGFIGLGIMGSAMCENIIRKHDDQVFVFDHVKEKTEALANAGGIACTSCRETAEHADLIITMVPKSEHVFAVKEEILPVLDGSKTWIDMSTIDPAVSVGIAEEVSRTGAAFLDAPVVKSRPAAEAGKLGIYVGGKQEDYEKVLPVLSYMGENIIRMGDNGKGLVMKICHNALVSQIQNGVNETSVLAEKNGIDILTFAKAISYGGGQNFYLDSKKNVIAAQDYTTAFSIANMHKDVHICLDLAKQSGTAMPGEENAAKVYDEAMEQGLGNEDFCATVKVVKGRTVC
ncbi:MAG TPA: 3-hydroxyisobutyrate dehydrogenase [Erysipelotrichaceae bacterium]|nr:3-hydroxyisobutyrate dehydrogenase [Erysipelotrichaceae bacterium]